MTYILSLDQGTTSSRAIVFDDHLTTVGTGQQSFEQLFPHPGWVEHDPETIWRSTEQSIQMCLAAASVDPADIAAIGITNQRETTIVWERDTGKPIYNAIVWQDRRTAAYCDSLKKDGCESLVFEKTGLVLDPYFSATKIRWILNNVPGARAAAERGALACGTIDTWLVWKLSGGSDHLIEVSNASRTQLVDIARGEWDQQLLDLFEIPASILPTIVASCGKLATSKHAPLSGIEITGMAGDQQAALFGQNCFAIGDSKCTYGTGCFLLTNVGQKPVKSSARLLTTVAWSLNGQLTYALEGSVFMGGALIQWLRDNLGLIEHAGEIEALAATVEDNGGVTLVPAFAGLGAPYWDAQARGTILGLTRGTSPGHLARAALEGIAMQVADVIDAMRADLAQPLGDLRVDGGACANNLLMQIQADVCDLNISRAKKLESTALGAAALAGLGQNLWHDVEDLASLWEPDHIFRPRGDRTSINASRETWLRAVNLASQWGGDVEQK